MRRWIKEKGFKIEGETFFIKFICSHLRGSIATVIYTRRSAPHKLADSQQMPKRRCSTQEGTDKKMKNIVNTTPHLIRMTDVVTGEVYEVPPCGILINAKATDVVVAGKHPSGADLVKVVFTADEVNTAALDKLEAENPNAVIIGSMIAAQAFPGRVMAMVAAPGFERVPPDQKRMRDDKFTTF